MNKICLICKKPIEQKTTGRPKEYCSTGCRRMAEREILRIEKRISDLEKRLMTLRTVKAGTRLASGTVEDEIKLVDDELQNQNDRFKALLETDTGQKKKAQMR